MTTERPIQGGWHVHVLDAISHPRADDRPGVPADVALTPAEPKPIEPLLAALDALDLP